MDAPFEWLPPSEVLDVLEAQIERIGPAVVWRALTLRRGQTAEDITAEVVLRHTVAAARWNPRDVPALYTSLDRPTAGAEGARLKQNQEHDEGVPSSMTMAIVPLEVRLEQVVDLHDPKRLPAVGIDDEVLRSQPRPPVESVEELDELSVAQRIGGAVWYLGYAGLLVPSVQRWPETNLVIFPDRLTEADYYERPSEVPSEEGAVD